MNGGAFRDAGAALERIAILEAENGELRSDLAKVDYLRGAAEELESLRREVKELRAGVRSENETAFLRRLGEERDELATEVRDLREKVREQEGELVRLRWRSRELANGDFMTGLVGRIFGKKR